ncbi:hypothetical protein N7475_002700 [Penicillium sp. IBT 31633x]|nr:hypothetical protein N7475_002700 [Penicillium sp. IBT 31633x]
MHDFGVSPRHTVILDLPVSLDPLNIIKGKAIIHHDPKARSRFGIFPRNNPARVRWFETEACFIFHTAATWDEIPSLCPQDGVIEAVSMLACRYKNANMLYSMGATDRGSGSSLVGDGSDSQLYYYRFALSDAHRNDITHQWALSSIPFEMPISCSHQMPNFIYGCTSTDAMFGARSGEPMKIDCLVKIDVQALIKLGMEREPESLVGCVDERSVNQILASDESEDPIQIFQAPEGWYVQEPQFVPRKSANGEDDGYLLTLVFDESQINDDGACLDHARSELWIIEALDMKTVVAKIYLPQRVPYGFHGNWFTQQQISDQRTCASTRTKQWNL